MSRNTDPRTKYAIPPMPRQQQNDQPGHTSKMQPEPDHGELTYRGTEKLSGQRALITGGDSGIGRAVAIAYAREGAKVAISYLPEEDDDAKTTAELVEESGQQCLLLPGDLRDEQITIDVVDRAVAEFGGIDILVLNAGTQRKREPAQEIDRAAIMKTFETNLVSPMIMTRAVVPVMSPGANIIVTASIQAFNPSPDLLDYAMTKSAQVAFVKALAEELGEAGIRVNAVAPGPIWTPLIPATGWTEKVTQFGADTPLGRPGQPAEVAPAYVFLASEESSYISGAVLPVTGGKDL